ncbi:hypothetical protein ACWGRV_38095 [Streptomyces sp. NPDC055663]
MGVLLHDPHRQMPGRAVDAAAAARADDAQAGRSGHADAVWVKLYVLRWLQAPLQLPNGTLQMQDRGTPQGSAVSPVLANLFMHYAFDA